MFFPVNIPKHELSIVHRLWITMKRRVHGPNRHRAVVYHSREMAERRGFGVNGRRLPVYRRWKIGYRLPAGPKRYEKGEHGPQSGTGGR